MGLLYSEAGTGGLTNTHERGIRLLGLRPSTQISLFLAVLVSSNVITFFLTTGIASGCVDNRLASLHNPVGRPALHRFFQGIDDGHHFQNFSAFSLKPSKYTAPASKDVDDAWSALGVDYDPFLVPADAAAEFSLTKGHVYQTAIDDTTTPHKGYVANMEGLHQLHCVNLVRQALFFNHEYYSSHARKHVGEAFHDDPNIVTGHVNLCIDML